jgi:serine/threonine protein kinase/beta-lactam-binding protein with PASTA domain
VADSVGQGVRLLAGRYQIGELIGRGGMADVRVGTDARLGRRVAIKLLKPALANDPAFRTRFRREAQDAAKMAHPTIVRIFDAGEETVINPSGNETQIPFIVMEYVDGRLLKDVLADGPLEPAEAVRIIEQVLTALEYSHRAGVVHRDIKPGNIMIASNGQVKVMDFGIARAISESSATIAETSAIVGTAQYFSPEQARGETVDARTDLYSTGVVLFELLTGQAPFRGENPVAVAYQHVNQNPVSPSSLNPKVSPALDAVVLRALAKDRFQRFQSASEFREQVEDASSGTAPGAPARRAAPVTDFNATLFGVNPHVTAGSEATIRQLTVDQNARDPRTQSRPPVAWIWAGIALMVVIVVAVIFWTLTLPKDNGLADGLSVKVPDVTGQSWLAAKKKLQDDKLAPQQVAERSASVQQGAVIRTDPGAGVKVGPEQPIQVFVSAGPNDVNVPDLSGFTATAAKAQLTDLGLALGSISHQDSPNIRKGIIISSSPDAGSPGSPGETVDLIVSTGLVNVPSVVGLSSSSAGSKLSALLLNVTVVPDNTCSGNKVTGQSLSVGKHPQKSAISITVCTGD